MVGSTAVMRSHPARELSAPDNSQTVCPRGDRFMRVTRRAVLCYAAAAAAISQQARAQETIKIGQLAPATGPNAQNGRFMINGAKLAVESVNGAGGVLGKPI